MANIFGDSFEYKLIYIFEINDEAHKGLLKIQMAKEMRLNPKSLIKNIPNKNEQWMTPVKIWVRDMYEDRFGRAGVISDNKNIKSKKKVEELPFD